MDAAAIAAEAARRPHPSSSPQARHSRKLVISAQAGIQSAPLASPPLPLYPRRMKKELIAVLLLALLLLPMWAGIRRIRNLPRGRPEEPPEP